MTTFIIIIKENKNMSMVIFGYIGGPRISNITIFKLSKIFRSNIFAFTKAVLPKVDAYISDLTLLFVMYVLFDYF